MKFDSIWKSEWLVCHVNLTKGGKDTFDSNETKQDLLGKVFHDLCPIHQHAFFTSINRVLKTSPRSLETQQSICLIYI